MSTSTATSTIDIRPGGIDRLFDAFDPAPLSERGLAVDAVAHLRDRLADLPVAGAIQIRVHFDGDDLIHADALERGVRRAFARAASKARRRLRAHWVRSALAFISAILLALLLIVAVEWLAEATGSAFMHRVAAAVTIVIWVVLWRPCEMVLFDWIDLRRDVRAFDRLASAEVVCCPAAAA